MEVRLHAPLRHIVALTFGVMLLSTAAYTAWQQRDSEAVNRRKETGLARPASRRQYLAAPRTGAVPFVRTELFFGTARPGGVVTREEFQVFLDTIVTPRFPDGLTALQGTGASRTGQNVLVSEASFVVILLYPFEASAGFSDRIQEIRELYRKRFDQESVLRVDDPAIVWASF